jgi:hypothetical protein
VYQEDATTVGKIGGQQKRQVFIVKDALLASLKYDLVDAAERAVGGHL